MAILVAGALPRPTLCENVTPCASLHLPNAHPTHCVPTRSTTKATPNPKTNANQRACGSDSWPRMAKCASALVRSKQALAFTAARTRRNKERRGQGNFASAVVVKAKFGDPREGRTQSVRTARVAFFGHLETTVAPHGSRPGGRSFCARVIRLQQDRTRHVPSRRLNPDSARGVLCATGDDLVLSVATGVPNATEGLKIALKHG